MESWQVEQQTRRVKGSSREEIESGLGMWKVNKCFTSTTLVFNTARSPIVKCMIDKYGDEKFVECLESDIVHEGAFCIKDALYECFGVHGATNDLLSRNSLLADPQRTSAADKVSFVADFEGSEGDLSTYSCPDF